MIFRNYDRISENSCNGYHFYNFIQFCACYLFVCALHVIELTLLCTVVKRRKQRKSTKRTSGKLVISYYAYLITNQSTRK